MAMGVRAGGEVLHLRRVATSITDTVPSSRLVTKARLAVGREGDLVVAAAGGDEARRLRACRCRGR